MNKKWCEYTGYTLDENRDLGWRRIIHPDDLERFVQAWTKSVTTGAPFESQHRLRRYDGVWRWHITRASPVRDDKERILRWVGSPTDVHDQRKQLEELAKTNTELKRFAYIASHDLVEPLRMVSSYTELLRKKFEHKLDAEAQQFISFAVEGAKRMNDLIQELLRYSRLTTQSEPFGRVDCNDICNGALSNLKVAIHNTNTQISKNTPPVS